MDFLDLSSYSTVNEMQRYPETDESALFADTYLPDYSFNNYDNDVLFDDPVTSFDPTFWSSGQSNVHNMLDSKLDTSTFPSTTASDPNAWSTLSPKSFGVIEDLSETFSPTNLAKVSTSPSLSIKSSSRRSHSSGSSDHHSGEDAITKPSPRKRGRPRLFRHSSGSSESISAPESTACQQRVPHNQVERKYREGLNMGLERLRRAVPTLLQSEKADVMGAAKPSKAMVLSAAIQYIKKIEKERDEAFCEIQRLEGAVRMGTVGSG